MADDDFIGRPLDLLLGYEDGMTLPTQRDWRDKQWHPEDALPDCKCPALKTRRGSEDGWALWVQRKHIGQQWKNADRRGLKTARNDAKMLKARQIARRLIQKGVVVMPEDNTDAARAEEALAYTVLVIQDAQEDTKHRLAAAKTLLEFTRTKPVVKAETTIKGALDWLNEIGG